MRRGGLEYDLPVKPRSQPSQEYATFTDALRRVLQVPYSEMKAGLKAEKKEKRPTSQKASSRVSVGKG